MLQLIRDNLKLFSASVVGDYPLFQVDTLLAVPDVVLHPTANEVFNIAMQCVRDCVEGYDRRIMKIDKAMTSLKVKPLPETTASVIVTRWPRVSHTPFSYSTYSRRHVIGYRRRSASLCLVRQAGLIIIRAVRHLATATLGMIGGNTFRAV